MHQDFILHDIKQSIVDRDLALFYEDRITRSVKRFGLNSRILSSDTIGFLVGKSSGLFIHAATVCRFIHDRGPVAGERLSILLNEGSRLSKPKKELDLIYNTVLEHSLPI